MLGPISAVISKCALSEPCQTVAPHSSDCKLLSSPSIQPSGADKWTDRLANMIKSNVPQVNRRTDWRWLVPDQPLQGLGFGMSVLMSVRAWFSYQISQLLTLPITSFVIGTTITSNIATTTFSSESDPNMKRTLSPARSLLSWFRSNQERSSTKTRDGCVFERALSSWVALLFQLLLLPLHP